MRAAPAANAPWSWPSFWRRARQAPHRFLALDYDGTLAPFQTERMSALPSAGTIPLLDDIAAMPRTALAILSGRPIAELAVLLGERNGIFSGSHGWEFRFPDGSSHVHQPDVRQKNFLDAAAARLAEIGLGQYVERKTASLAFHTRAVPEPEAQQLAARADSILTPMIAGARIERRPFNGGVEYRCADRNKGTAFAELLVRQPRGSFPVYIGDDDTDEDVFRALFDVGAGIKVGAENSESAAALRLADCQAVVEFLTEWKRRLSEKS